VLAKERQPALHVPAKESSILTALAQNAMAKDKYNKKYSLICNKC